MKTCRRRGSLACLPRCPVNKLSPPGNVDNRGTLTEAVLLGTVSYRSGRPLAWDAAKLKADVPEAERYIHKEYRKEWAL